LVVAALAVMLGTLYPLVIDALGMGKISVGPPYFDAVFMPLMAPAVFLMGIGPLARWKNAELPALAMRLRWAAAVAIAGALITGALLSPLAVGQTAPTTSLPTSTSAGNSAKMDEAVTLSVFTVSEEKDLGYESMQTTSGMRTAQELKNVANSISIMNAQFIEDLGLTTMEEMSTWMVSGESNPDPNALVQSRVILRGVPNAYALRNGWIWYSPMDAFSTEKVEELRGPNAFLYGEADVGGANNQITKRGLLSRDLTRAKIMAGSDNLFRAEVDFNRRLIRDKLAVRLSAVNSHNDSWIDNVRRDFRGIYSAITYRPTQQTLITVMAEHDRTAAVLSQGMMIDAFSRTATATLVMTATSGMAIAHQPRKETCTPT